MTNRKSHNQKVFALLFGLLLTSSPLLYANAEVNNKSTSGMTANQKTANQRATASQNINNIYQDSCATCHETGALNAPKTGDKVLWNQLKAQKGMNKLVDNVKNGLSQMPAGGLCADCNDNDYKALIELMSK